MANPQAAVCNRCVRVAIEGRGLTLAGLHRCPHCEPEVRHAPHPTDPLRVLCRLYLRPTVKATRVTTEVNCATCQTLMRMRA